MDVDIDHVDNLVPIIYVLRPDRQISRSTVDKLDPVFSIVRCRARAALCRTDPIHGAQAPCRKKPTRQTSFVSSILITVAYRSDVVLYLLELFIVINSSCG